MEELFNVVATADVAVQVSGSAGDEPSVFYLHKFPLMARSTLFKRYFEAFPSGFSSKAGLAALFSDTEDYSCLLQPSKPSDKGSLTVYNVL